MVGKNCGNFPILVGNRWVSDLLTLEERLGKIIRSCGFHFIIEYTGSDLDCTGPWGPKMTAFHNMMLFSPGAPETPAGGSSWSLLKSLISRLLAAVDMIGEETLALAACRSSCTKFRFVELWNSIPGIYAKFHETAQNNDMAIFIYQEHLLLLQVDRPWSGMSASATMTVIDLAELFSLRTLG